MSSTHSNKFRVSSGVILNIGLLLLSFVAAADAHADSMFSVSVDTLAISGTSGQLVLDLLNGGSAANIVTISEFSTDGILGATSWTGQVTGSLPGNVSLTDSPLSFFNEYVNGLTLGQNLSFLLTATTNGPDTNALPDALSLFLADPATGLPLFSTSDPTGSDSLLTLNIDGTSEGSLSIYSAPGGEAVSAASVVSGTPVSEPGTALLILVGLVTLLASGRSRRRISGSSEGIV